MEKTALHYDGSWEGLLCVIFEAFEYKLEVSEVLAPAYQRASLFDRIHQVHTLPEKATRVREGLLKKVGKRGLSELFEAHLSELEAIPLVILRVASYYFQSGSNARYNYGHAAVLTLKETVKSVSRERHRMKAFVRFQRLQDDLYVALVSPDFNVLPLIAKHFKDRYADQRWLIYDEKRDYGIYYDLATVTEVQFSTEQGISQQIIAAAHDSNEDLYSDLWKRYFKAVNIEERKNTKLHVQHVPKRYWKYLNEKDGF